jgi:N-acetylglucosamine kinase-like BadF-type ATPase
VGFLIGIDGGGTKTQFALADFYGQIHSQYQTTGSSYKEIGMAGVCDLIVSGIDKVCSATNIVKDKISGVCFGMPCYGESKENDLKMTDLIKQALAPLEVCIENDVTAAWAGALAFQPGIILLAGTGSMAVGRNYEGEFARSGGWSTLFSDEGSGYWLGKKTLELFTKQSDFRLPKGPLYEIVKTHLNLNDDFELIDLAELIYSKSRRKTAALQFLLMESATAGDEYAIRAYSDAAYELSLLVAAIRHKLKMEDKTIVSYSGGLFKAGDFIMKPLKDNLNLNEIEFKSPLLQPVGGAILFAAESFANESFEIIRQGMLGPIGKMNVLA